MAAVESSSGDRGFPEKSPAVGGREVAPSAITGQETSRELLREAFPAFAGRNMREALRLMEESISSGAAVFATLAGAATPAGLHLSCVAPLIELGVIDCLTTTGANLYHDLHRLLGYSVAELSHREDDHALRRKRVIRIYDLALSEDSLLATDRWLQELFRTEDFQSPMTTPEFHHRLGAHADRLSRKTGKPSLLATCYRHGLPIFCGAPQDGSLFLSMARLERKAIHDGRPFGFRLELGRDIYQMAALQHLARQRHRKTAIWIFGGGVPKNYTLQAEPMLQQLLGVEAPGFDYDVQLCVDVEDSGALSPCGAGEGHTWGKVAPDCASASSIYLRSDLTVALPWLTHALVGQGQLRRKPRRLIDSLPEAVELLDNVLRSTDPSEPLPACPEPAEG